MGNYSKLDRPDVLAHIFYPRQLERTPLPPNSCDFDCSVEENITLGCRFHSCSEEAPTLLYFHGNAETVSDYDEIGQQYTAHGMNVLFTTYRGYGWSGGSPSVTSMFQDADILLQKSQHWLDEKGYAGPLFLMGRSLGSTSAIDLARHHQETIKGLIIESGFSDTMPLTKTLGIDTEKNADITEDDCFNNCPKIAEVTIPTFILHGADDSMIPVALAEKLQACSGAKNKQFMVIPRAEHNTLIVVGGDRYFQVIKKFINDVCGLNDWRTRRRKFKQQAG